MRASSLSDERVIRLVSKYFVPVHVSRDNYLLATPEPATLRELERIDAERKSKNLEGGIVAVYILKPDGSVIASIPVQKAFYPDKLLAFLEKAIADNEFTPRLPADVQKVAAEPPPQRRSKTSDGLLLHIRTRYGDDKNKDKNSSVDVLDLTAEEWQKLVPTAEAKVGATWTIAEKTADRLLVLCYPPGPHWNTNENKITARSLTATLVSVDESDCLVKLTGTVSMLHPFTGKPDDNRVTARLIGYVHYDREQKTITTLNVAGQEAVYQRYWQAKALPAAPFHIGVGLTP